jgi:hypothetical protein
MLGHRTNSYDRLENQTGLTTKQCLLLSAVRRTDLQSLYAEADRASWLILDCPV